MLPDNDRGEVRLKHSLVIMADIGRDSEETLLDVSAEIRVVFRQEAASKRAP